MTPASSGAQAAGSGYYGTARSSAVWLRPVDCVAAFALSVFGMAILVGVLNHLNSQRPHGLFAHAAMPPAVLR